MYARSNGTTAGAATALLACIAVALPAAALAATETKVTIKANGGDFSGTVKSKKAKCTEGREVVVYKQEGKRPDPKSDAKIASDDASLNGNRYEWSTGNTGAESGKYYAYARKRPGCDKATSKTVKVVREGPEL